MKLCDGCGNGFDQRVPLLPRLLYDAGIQVAQTLQGKPRREEMLCPRCWLEAAGSADQADLAYAAMGLMQRLIALEQYVPISVGPSHNDLFKDISIIERDAPVRAIL